MAARLSDARAFIGNRVATVQLPPSLCRLRARDPEAIRRIDAFTPGTRRLRSLPAAFAGQGTPRRYRMERAPARWMVTVILLMLVNLQACARSVPEIRHVAVNARFTLLIASDASAFKDAVRGRIFDYYKSNSNVEVVNIARLKTFQAEDFDAVLIIDTCMGWSQFNPSMKTFLDGVSDPAHVVLFMTVDDTDWEFSYRGVDAITSASRLEDEDRVATNLIRKIDTILQRRSASGA
jgi:hypothetical protein